jgi:magnesium transporter
MGISSPRKKPDRSQATPTAIGLPRGAATSSSSAEQTFSRTPGVEAIVDSEGPASEGPQQADRERLQAWVFRKGSDPRSFEVDELPQLAANSSNLAYVELSEYTQTRLEEVARLLKLDPLSLRSALSAWQEPHIDSYGEYFYLSVTVPEVNDADLTVAAGELGVWVGRNFIITAHRTPLAFMDGVMGRLQQSPELASLHTAYALYIVLDELVNFYTTLLERLEDAIEQTEERALRETSDQFLAHLLHLKRYVFAIGRLAGQHSSVFAAFRRPDFTFTSGPDVEPYFRDLEAALSRVVDRLLGSRESVNGAFDIYVSHMSHRTNALISVLTVISTVILPATLVVAITQTLFRLPIVSSWQGVATFAAGLILIPAAILVVVLRRRLI